MIYPYTTPVIMNDDVFQAYGGLLADTITEMRDASYTIAEQLVSEDLETFLTYTTVTGTYFASPLVELDHMRLIQVHGVTYFDELGNVSETVSDYSRVRIYGDGDYGIVDLRQCWPCNRYIPSAQSSPCKVLIAYTAGLPPAMTFVPNFLMALTIISKVMLNEMVGFGNEAPGDIGVVRFSNQDYSEQRVALLRTVYGTSPQAALAHKLLTPYRLYRQVKL